MVLWTLGYRHNLDPVSNIPQNIRLVLFPIQGNSHKSLWRRTEKKSVPTCPGVPGSFS